MAKARMPQGAVIIPSPTPELGDPALEAPPNGRPADPEDLTDDELEQDAAGDITILSDASFANYHWSIWRKRTPAELQLTREKAWEYVGKEIGPIDIDAAVTKYGGGYFEFRGYFDRGDGRGRRMARRVEVPLAGPRKDFSVPPPAPPAPPPAVTTPAPNNGIETLFGRLLDRMERLEERVSQPQSSTSLKELAETMVLLNGLNRAPAAAAPFAPDSKVVEMMLGMVEKGIALGQTREPGEPQGTDWAGVLAQALPTVNKTLDLLASRARGPQPVRAPVTDRAQVVETPNNVTVIAEPPPAEPEPAPQVNHRFLTAVDALAEAIAAGDDPREFAVTLERILEPADASALKLANTDQVLEQLKPFAATYGVLVTDDCRHFVDELLSELRNPSDVDANDSEAAD